MKKVIKKKAKVTATPEVQEFGIVTSTPINNVVVVPKIAKLEVFGNEDMHRVVAKINEIIDAL